ncbi:MAG: glycosyltransferase family 25 protein [Pseudomonadota bacterium]|nr:glycosyltransferase family 25 protein [Pseudomonadota bacterium]
MLTVLINLESAEARRAHMEAQLARAGFDAVRIGVDFRESTTEEVSAWTEAHFPRLRFDLDAMCAAEAGCWASHLCAWSRLLETDELSCTVLEDDILLTPGFREAVDALREQACFDVIYLGTSSKNISTRRRTQIGALSVHQPLGVIFNTWGYVITRAYAQRFFDSRPTCIDMPIDDFLGGRAKWAKPRSGVLRPAIVTEDPVAGPRSQIQPYATRADRHPIWQDARRALLGSKVSDLYYSLYKWL